MISTKPFFVKNLLLSIRSVDRAVGRVSATSMLLTDPSSMHTLFAMTPLRELFVPVLNCAVVSTSREMQAVVSIVGTRLLILSALGALRVEGYN